MEEKKTVLILSSPTASGKTTVALEVSRRIPVEIISADSRQVYKYLNIGTAKPARAERDEVPHHFIDMLEPDQSWNAGKFSREARRLIMEIFKRGRIPFIVGGTGLYLKALVDGIVDIPETDPDVRDKISKRFEREGLEPLTAELKKIDPSAYNAIDLRNPRRVMRSLEIFYMTGMKRSEIENKSDDPLPNPLLWFGLEWERGKLYKRIDERVDTMIENGLIDEVRSVLDKGFNQICNAFQSVGYSETIDYLEGKINREEMVRLIKQNTRQYAKRQLTWFGKEKRIRWLDIDSENALSGAANEITSQYEMSVKK